MLCDNARCTRMTHVLTSRLATDAPQSAYEWPVVDTAGIGRSPAKPSIQRSELWCPRHFVSLARHGPSSKRGEREAVLQGVQRGGVGRAGG